MASVDYIDLSKIDENRNGNSIGNNSNQFLVTPGSIALKNIGLSLIKYQYGESINRQNKPIEVPKEPIWSSLWQDNQLRNTVEYPLKYMLESKFDKQYRCPYSRSHFCQNQEKMTRINYAHHIRRGHVRVNLKWRKMMKTGGLNKKIIEVCCIICPKNKEFLSLNDFRIHMNKKHSHIPLYDGYLAFFERCLMCNETTGTVSDNVSHRQLCSNAFSTNSNHPGTRIFNGCFSKLRILRTLSISWPHYHDSDFIKRFNRALYDDNVKSLFKMYFMYQQQESQKHLPTSVRTAPLSRVVAPICIIGTTSVAAAPSAPQAISVETSERIEPNFAMSTGDDVSRFVHVPTKFVVVPRLAHVPMSPALQALPNLPVVSNLECEICASMIRDENTLYLHIKLVHPNYTVKTDHCRMCGRRFYTEEAMVTHLTNSMSNCQMVRKCRFCGSKSPMNCIYDHIRAVHPNELNGILDDGTECLICNRPCTADDGLRRHLLSWHGLVDPFVSHVRQQARCAGAFVVGIDQALCPCPLYSCSRCSYTYLTQAELVAHTKQVKHSLRCSECQFECESVYDMRVHIVDNHAALIGRSVCELCGTQFKGRGGGADKIAHFVLNHERPCGVVLAPLSQSNRLGH